MDNEDRVCRPFKSLEELYANLNILTPWPQVAELRETAEYVFRGSEADIQDEKLHRVGRDSMPKTIVCHDMKGGYLADRFVDGSSAHDSYVFYHWSVVDTFIYFSHNLVTVPPYGWINAAHIHGVKVLGTVITERTDGQKVWEHVLESEEETKMFADALIKIAKEYKFDGWLLNVENKIKETDVEKLEGFVRYLTDNIHREIDGSEIIWYDSVVSTGELKWQDELNERNERFFSACDGIFLNYNWTDVKLASSRANAEKDDRIRDVYVGLDVWGRGCPGGGGFNSKHALERIRRHDLSVAIFAPGWTHEYFGSEAFRWAENLFWAQLTPCLYFHVPLYDNEIFATSFCRGAGTERYRSGKVTLESEASNEHTPREKSFYNLAMQKPQVSVPTPHMTFVRKALIIAGETKKETNTPTDDWSKSPESKEPAEIVYETVRDIVRVSDKKISLQPKIHRPALNFFEFYTESSYDGGGCLMLVNEDPNKFHRLFLVHIDYGREILVHLTYRKVESNAELARVFDDKPVIMLGNDTGLRSIDSSASMLQLDSQWKKEIYLTNLKTVNEICIAFPTRGIWLLGEIVLEQKTQWLGESVERYVSPAREMPLAYRDSRRRI